MNWRVNIYSSITRKEIMWQGIFWQQYGHLHKDDYSYIAKTLIHYTGGRRWTYVSPLLCVFLLLNKYLFVKRIVCCHTLRKSACVCLCVSLDCSSECRNVPKYLTHILKSKNKTGICSFLYCTTAWHISACTLIYNELW